MDLDLDNRLFNKVIIINNTTWIVKEIEHMHHHHDGQANAHHQCHNDFHGF